MDPCSSLVGMKSSRKESIFSAEMPLIKSVGVASDTPVALIPQKFVGLYHTNTYCCYTSIVDYSSASCVSAIVKPRDFVVMILGLFCLYCGLKIMELKNSFPVTFSALEINLQKFTIFPLGFVTTC